MGGRGAFIGKTNILKEQKFKTVLRIGNIRVIEPISKNERPKTPTLSRSPRAIYAALEKDGRIKQIAVYGKNREKLYDIDLSHDHTNGKYPGGHVQYYINGKRSNDYKHLNAKQRKLAQQLTYGLEAAEYEKRPTTKK